MKRALAALGILGAVGVALLLAEPWARDGRGIAVGDAVPAVASTGPVATSLRGGGGDVRGDPGADVAAPTAVIRGRVRDERGAAIAGASIRSIPQASVGGRAAEGVPVSTDESGSFEIEAIGATAFAICAEAAGFAPRTEQRVRDGDVVDFELARAVTLEGVVVDAESRPVPDTSIGFLTTLGPIVIERSTTSDATGAWRLADLPPESDAPWLSARAEGFAPYLSGDLVWTPLEGVVRTAIVLRRGGSVSGRVVDATSGAPIAGARVRVTRRLWGMANRTASIWRANVGETATDAAGAFRIGPLPDARPPVDLAVLASAAGHAEVRQEIPSIRDGGMLTLDLGLPRAGSVRGRIADRHGKPVAGLRVTVETWSRYGGVELDARGDDDECVSGPDGAYRVEGIDAGSFAVTLTARRDTGQHAWARLEGLRPKPGEDVVADLLAVVAPAAVVRVVNTDGRAIPGALVEVTGLWQDQRRWFTGADGRVLVSFDRDPEKFRGVETFVRVSARGFVDVVSPPCFPDPDMPPEIVATLARASELRCHVQWADGSDAAGVPVGVARADAPIAGIWPVRNEAPVDFKEDPVLSIVQTDARGRCRFEGLPAGPWHVAAWLGSQDTEPAARVASVSDDSREVLLAFEEVRPAVPASPETTDVDVAVVDSQSGRPVLDATVVVEKVQALVVGPGIFRRPAVPREPVKVVAYAPGYPKPVKRTVDLGVRGRERLELRLEPGLVVNGRARLPEGMVLSGAALGCSWGNRKGRKSVPLPPSGEFEVRGIPCGVDVELDIEGSAGSKQDLVTFVHRPFAPIPVPMGARELALGDVAFVPASCLRVRLSDHRSGQPSLPHWDLTVRAIDGSWSRTWSVPGHHMLAWLPSGEVAARCDVPGADPVFRNATIVGFVSDLEFAIR